MNHRSFTLIELLVVITIIGVLSAIVITTITNASAKARDSQRISELNQIKNVFEQYFYDSNFHYPIDDTGGSGFCMKDNSSFLASLSEYAPFIPEDPKGGDWPCYRYYSDSEGTGYILTCQLESNSSQMQGDGGKSNDLYEVYDDTGYIEEYVEGGGGGYFPPEWLIGWDKRIEVIASNTNVDSDLTHFPILLALGTSVGTGNDDVSAIFDELTSDANRKKIAVTKTDGTTELYVEIEDWDDANEQAWLWVSKSDLVLDADDPTYLYIYYDIDHADNDTYVGDTNDEIAENVWDDNFKAVYHMADGVDTSHIYDSTNNDNDGTKVGANEPVEAAGVAGKAQQFDGSNDYIRLTDQFDFEGDFTWEVVSKASTYADFRCMFQQGIGNAAYDRGFSVQNIISPDYLYVTLEDIDGSYGSCYTSLSTYDWKHLSARILNNEGIWTYIDGVNVTATIAPPGQINEEGDGPPWIGRDADAREWAGSIDELRISDIRRSIDWLEVTYETIFDNLVAWGTEETF